MTARAERERWDARQCADHLGIAVSTWWKYVSADEKREPAKRHLPARCPTVDPKTGNVRWFADEVRQYATDRPGRGYRTDKHGGTRNRSRPEPEVEKPALV